MRDWWGYTERWHIRGNRFPDEPGREEHEARACGARWTTLLKQRMQTLGPSNWTLALYAALIEHLTRLVAPYGVWHALRPPLTPPSPVNLGRSCGSTDPVLRVVAAY